METRYYALIEWEDSYVSIIDVITILHPRKDVIKYQEGEAVKAKFRGAVYEAVICEISEDRKYLEDMKKKGLLKHRFCASQDREEGPQKRLKKKYIDNPDAVVPRSTKHYKRKKESDSFVSEHGEEECQDGDELNMPALSEIECEIITENQENNLDMHQVLEVQTDVFQTEDNNNTRKYEGDDNQLCMNDDKSDEYYSSVDGHENNFISSSDEREFSDSSESDSSFSCDADELEDKVDYEDVEMMLLSCFLRNNFSASSSKDILSTMKKAFPDCRPLQELYSMIICGNT
ncbi:uncharacterized protein LOC133176321 [Saccostrea echinata]|uniref:uncharacterized protein LOC133176321 n=1 Tax=Saccostrea echinata TaxID=191078 RepID=UPI002A83B27F|nr:uncharacterized protein LOC133176321 [Saccostrea echinata]